MTNPKNRSMSRAEALRAFASRMATRRVKRKIVWPVVEPGTLQPLPVTYGYGIRSSAYAAGRHTGEDHACPVGSLAIATTWGEVLHAGPSSPWGAAYGTQVLIRTGDGKYDYAHNHLSQVLVKPGDKVHPGMVVGYTGATGNVTGPHDHFEARTAGGRYGSDVPPLLVKARRR